MIYKITPPTAVTAVRSSARKPTKAQGDRIAAVKAGPCVICWLLAERGELDPDLIVRQCDYHHFKSGNVRRGHAFGIAACIWHHRGYPMLGNVKRTREVYGHSLMDGSRTFHQLYGSDDSLLKLQDRIQRAMR